MRRAAWLSILPLPSMFLLSSLGSAATIHVPGDEPTIQAGIDIASVGDTVLVAAGEYSGNGNRDLDFMGKDLVLRSETGAEFTTIYCGRAGWEFHRGFYFHHGESAACVVQGFTIRDGGGYEGSGGGMYCYGASPSIIGCIFRDNSVGPEDGNGGAAVLAYSASRFLDCEFLGNVAVHDGGAVKVGYSSAVSFEHCTFCQNHSVDAKYAGGAVNCYGDQISFANCTFESNRAGFAGGALYLLNTAAALDLCVFSSNRVDEDDDGLAYAGAVECAVTEGTEAIQMSDCSFWGNRAKVGGAVQGYGLATIDIQGSTIASNDAETGTALALSNQAGTSLTNCVLAFGTRGDEAPITCDGGAQLLSVTCCDVFGNHDGDWVGCLAPFEGLNGNFRADPRFCDLPSGDLTLESRSPCVPGQHPGGEDCGLIGAFGIGCTNPTTTVPSTWGSLKSRFGITRPWP